LEHLPQQTEEHSYLPNGESIEVAARNVSVRVAETFNATRVEAAVRESQAGVHTGGGKLRRHRLHYSVAASSNFGRTTETHVERFPSAKQMGVLAKIAAASFIARRKIQYVEPFLQGVRKSATQELVVNERLDE